MSAPSKNTGLRIAIIELYEHDEVVSYLCQVLSTLVTLTVYASQEVLTLSDLHGAHAQAVDIANRKAAMQNILVDAASADGIIVVTTMVDHRPWQELTKCELPNCLFVHNANWSLSNELPWHSFDVPSILRRLKWQVRGHLSKRRAVTALFDALVFPSEQIATRVSERTSQRCFGLPWAVMPDPVLPRKVNEEHRVVCIPGTVNPSVRDYVLLAEVLGRLAEEDKKKLEFVLLGQASAKTGRMVVERLDQFTPKLRSFDHYLPKQQYETELEAADVILDLQRPQVAFATTIEVPGQTKQSGVVHDAIRHHKRVLNAYSSSTTTKEAVLKLTRELTRLAKGESIGTVTMGYSLSEHRRRWSNFLERWMATE